MFFYAFFSDTFIFSYMISMLDIAQQIAVMVVTSHLGSAQKTAARNLVFLRLQPWPLNWLTQKAGLKHVRNT